MNIKMLTSFLVLLILGCELSDTKAGETDYLINYRFVVEHKSFKSKTISVYLEGYDGNSVTGSVVIVKNSQNIATLINYDYTKGCYFGDIPTSVDGKYKLTVSSSVLDKDIVQEFNNYDIPVKPDLIKCVDENNNDALSGNELDINTPIHIGWNKVDNATVYQIVIMMNGSKYKTYTTSSDSFIIPGDDITSSGRFSINVIAQNVIGDPMLKNSNFYSYSESIGSSLLFICN